MTEPIRFYFRGAVHEVRDQKPTRTVLQYLREDLRCLGTKEGCAEGDCGACTVVLGALNDDELVFNSVNACIALLSSLDGKALFTVEDLAQSDASLHPVQQALVECHASQCGFCTPGFAMSLWSLYQQQQGGAATRAQIDTALSGNLCRCTGYRPIIDAARRMHEYPGVRLDQQALAQQLRALARRDSLAFEVDGQRCHAARSVDELLQLRANWPEAIIVAGGTDVGLWITKQMRELEDLILLGQVSELQTIVQHADVLEIGAGVTLERAYAALSAQHPQLTRLWQRFASLPIRHAGTLGGNVANGSPIGDSMPWLIALGTTIVLGSVRGRRVLALEDFYLDYQQRDLAPDECVLALRVPLPRAQQRWRTYKLAKRFDQDISAVCAAFAVTLDQHDTVQEARIAFGGMAATPRRAARAEAALCGQPWQQASVSAAMQALAEDFQPLSDQRASSNYRVQAAQNLLQRFWLETRTDDPLPESALDVFTAKGAAHA